jgi:excisionase family DNA binding protein
MGGTTIYQAINDRELRALKFGHRTLIFATDLQSWLKNLTAARSSTLTISTRLARSRWSRADM